MLRKEVDGDMRLGDIASIMEVVKAEGWSGPEAIDVLVECIKILVKGLGLPEDAEDEVMERISEEFSRR